MDAFVLPAVYRQGPRRVTERDAATTDRLKRDEVALLYRIRDKDETAVAELYARYSGSLYSLAYQVTRAERFAQEVVQEVFLGVWREANARRSMTSTTRRGSISGATGSRRPSVNCRRHSARAWSWPSLAA